MRFRISMAVAGAVHVGVVLLVATRSAPIAVSPPPPEELVPILVDLFTEAPALLPAEPVAVPAAVAAAPAPAGPAAPRKAKGPLAVAGAGRGDIAASGGAGEGAGLVPGGSDAPAGSAPPTPVPDRALPPPLLPLAVQAPAAVLMAPLGATQAAAGLTAGAQVVATAQSAADGKGPSRGHGTLRITVEQDGSVSAVSVSGVGWEAAAQAIRAALAGRRLRVPSGARGVVISLALDAAVSYVPAVLTGEARAAAVGFNGAVGGVEDNHHGFHPGAANMAVINPTALLPLRRRSVKVEILGEQAR
jgi:hypothetical protein